MALACVPVFLSGSWCHTFHSPVCWLPQPPTTGTIWLLSRVHPSCSLPQLIDVIEGSRVYIPCIYAVNKVGAREGGGCPCLVGENNEGGAPRPSLNWLAVPLGPGFVLLRWPDALALCVLVHLSVHAAFSMHTAKWGPPGMLRPIPLWAVLSHPVCGRLTRSRWRSSTSWTGCR